MIKLYNIESKKVKAKYSKEIIRKVEKNIYLVIETGGVSYNPISIFV